jgi:ATP-dependent Clp protease ATP-binding subunit ClpA
MFSQGPTPTTTKEAVMDIMDQFTEAASRVVALSEEEARFLGHDFIGTEHIMLGLIHEGQGVGAQVLVELGITLEKARRVVENKIVRGGTSPAHLPHSPRALMVLRLASRQAMQLTMDHIDTEHLLLALLHEGEGVACQILVNEFGLRLDDIRNQVIAMLYDRSASSATIAPEPILEPPPRRTQSHRSRTSNGSTVVIFFIPSGFSEDQVGELRDLADKMLKK